VRWLGAGECSFSECEVGVQVHLRGFDLLVSEPQRDHGGVDPGVQRPHRRGVAQDVRRDRLRGQRLAALGGVGRVLGDPPGERFARVSGLPVLLGNSGSAGELPRSASHR
jgi:hypothetical protein